MKNVIIIIFLVLFSSCKVFKNFHKEKTKQTTLTYTKTITTTTVTERIDTAIVIKSDTVRAQGRLDSLLTGHDIKDSSAAGVTIIHYDTVFKKIYIKSIAAAKTVTVYINKTTTEKKEVDQKTKTKTETFKKDKVVERSAGFNWFWIGLAAGIFLILLLIRLMKHFTPRLYKIFFSGP
jgi:hypothetical protein